MVGAFFALAFAILFWVAALFSTIIE